MQDWSLAPSCPVSIEELMKAAENLDKPGEPVTDLSRRVPSLLTGGANK